MNFDNHSLSDLKSLVVHGRARVVVGVLIVRRLPNSLACGRWVCTYQLAISLDNYIFLF